MQNRNKRYIENEMKHLADLVEDLTGKSEISLLRGSFANRRTKALLSVLDRAETEFGKPVIKTLVHAELRPLVTYNSINQDDDLTIGAALWILDRMRGTEQFLEMEKMLPDLMGEDAFFLPTDFSHPCFSNELINTVMYVLKYKHREKRGGQPVTDSELASEAAARGERAEEAYTKLMDMLPEEEVQKACIAFKEKQWELLGRYIRCDRWLDNRLKQIPADPVIPFAASPLPLMGSGLQVIPETEKEKICSLKASLPRLFSDYLQMNRKQILRETGSRVMADELAGFTIDDPYEICYAVYYLIGKGDDAPWLVSSGSHLCEFAVHMLPWFVDHTNWDDDDWDNWTFGLTYNANGWLEEEPPEEEVDFYHTKHQGQTLAQIVYGLSRGIVPVGKHPFEKERKKLIEEGMDERTARKVIDMAEMLFLREFQAQVYKPFEWEKEEEPVPDGDLEESPAEEKEQKQQPEAESPEELKKAKNEIKALREALYRERREASDERAKYEHELKTLRMEHRELADLRTLVFNSNREDQKKVEKTERQYTFPYETRRRTVVFGGHDSFLRAFKPKFPDVKFVDARNMTFSPEIIRNAEVVWIQNNCISHPQYWNIVKNCKQAGVQMRYFGFASAEKCAEQLVTEDERN